MIPFLENKQLALIIPVYNEGKALVANFTEIKKILDEDHIKCQFHFIDDGSKDNTWEVIESLSNKHSNVSGIKFARNFG